MVLSLINQDYIEKLNGETDKKMDYTNIKISNKKLLNKNWESYDIAVMFQHAAVIERRG